MGFSARLRLHTAGVAGNQKDAVEQEGEMPIQEELDAQIQQRLEDLLLRATQLDKEANETVWKWANNTRMRFFALKTNFLAVLMMLGSSFYINSLVDEVTSFDDPLLHLDNLAGMIIALAEDYESGMLKSVIEEVEAEVTINYLEQAEELLSDAPAGTAQYGPSAVLLGTILENSLRLLCGRQIPPIDTYNNGNHKKMNTLIDDLKKAGLFNEAKAKQLRAWAGIRNHAAHGQFDEFTREDVDLMLKGIRNFLGDYM